MSSKRYYPEVKYERDTEQLLYEGNNERRYYSIAEDEPVKPARASLFSANRKTLVVTLCILVTEMCERLTYYSIAAGLVLYCTSELDINQVDATTINQVFSGFVYIIPILGGFLSDAYFGRFKTILFACGLYLIGVILLPASAIDYDSWGWGSLTNGGQTGIFVCGLVFVALGTGGIKANVGPFGAEQVEAAGKEAVQSFFNWFYWVINVGALIAYVGVAYIEQEVSFGWGFFVPMASMFVAVAIFAVAKRSYITTDPRGSILTTACGICKQGGCKSPPARNERLPEGSEEKYLARAKNSFGGDFEDHIVDGVVSVIKVTPFCLLVVMYWAIYAQMTNTFFAQSERMDVRLGDGINIPAAALNAFNTISIIILIPIVDRLVYPCFEKLGKPLTYLKRIGIGMILAALGVFAAGVVEIYRKDTDDWHLQVLASENFTASSMSVFVQIPQFTLIGASEIFASVTTLEFAYNQAPVAMQGLLTGLFLAASGVGNWVSSAILAIVEKATEDDPWWSDEINDAHMEYLLFLLGGLMILNFLGFCVVAHYYTYQDPKTFEKMANSEEVMPGPVTISDTVPDGYDLKNHVNNSLGNGTRIEDTSIH